MYFIFELIEELKQITEEGIKLIQSRLPNTKIVY